MKGAWITWQCKPKEHTLPSILQFLLKLDKIRPTDWLHLEDVRCGPMPMYSYEENDSTQSQRQIDAPDREFNFRDTDTSKVWDLGNIDTSGAITWTRVIF